MGCKNLILLKGQFFLKGQESSWCENSLSHGSLSSQNGLWDNDGQITRLHVYICILCAQVKCPRFVCFFHFWTVVVPLLFWYGAFLCYTCVSSYEERKASSVIHTWYFPGFHASKLLGTMHCSMNTGTSQNIKPGSAMKQSRATKLFQGQGETKWAHKGIFPPTRNT